MNTQKQKRKRGVVLTPEGLQRLQDARFEMEVQENDGTRYTLEKLSELSSLDLHTIRKVLEGKQGVDKRSLERFFLAFKLKLEPSDCASNADKVCRADWGEAPCVEAFYGRKSELGTLEEWVLTKRCRLIAIVGMGGVGKTCLSVKLGRHIQDNFECTIWRSLRDAPPLKEILADLLQFLSDGEETGSELDSLSAAKSRLVDYLRQRRCLIILDNAESLLRGGMRAGQYREGYEGYGELLKLVGETVHQSCLIVTSREKPKEVALLEGEATPVRSLQLGGVEAVDGEEIFKLKGLSASQEEWAEVVERYTGNPLALKIVATTLQDIFGGNVAEFLSQDAAVFGDIRDILQQQFERLSDLEKDIMYWLAINREPISLSQLQEDIVSPIPQARLVESLESLGRRSLVEKSLTSFTLQPVVMEYVTSRLIKRVCDEIYIAQPDLFKCHALIKATAKDYVKDTQIRLIARPVIDDLLTIFGSKGRIENQLGQILVMSRERAPLERSYTAGNVLNLLVNLETDLTGYDFSDLAVWQADLRNVKLHDVNFQNADLAKSVFAESFGGVISVAFSPDGKLLAMGDTNGEIYLRQVSDGKHILTCKGHTNWVTSVAFSFDGKTLVSSSSDYTVKLWNISTGQCLQNLQGHESEVWSVAFSSNGDLLVSGSDDNTMKLWSVRTGECLKTFQGHKSWVCSVAFSPDGKTLVSGSHDQTVGVWDIKTGELLKSFQGHQDGIRSITFSADGKVVASGSEDKTVKLWDVRTGECLQTFQGHSGEVYSVVFSPQGNLLASGSFDQTVKLWDVSTGECLKTFQGHSSWVYSVAFSSQGDLLASGSYDQTVRLWSFRTGECLKAFQGYTHQVLSVAFSPDGQTLASASHDSLVRLWHVSTGQCLKTFHGHCAAIQSVTFNPDGQMLASGGDDRTVRLWNVNKGQLLQTLQGHKAAIRSVAFSPDGLTLASGSEDQTVKLWDVNTGQLLRTFQGHKNQVWSVAFNPQGTMLTSSGLEETVKLWDVSTCECLKTLEGHTSWAWSIAFSPNGEMLVSTSTDQTLRLWSVSTGECLRLLQVDTGWLLSVAFSLDSRTLASSCQDQTVKLWDVTTGECLKTLQGHTGGWIRSVAFSPDNQILASGGEDETIRLWEVTTGECLKILKAEKPYERMNIMGVTGLTTATIATLKVLGAVAAEKQLLQAAI